MTFGEKVKALRYKLYMSQTEFAEKLNVNFTTVNRWERGRNKPTFKAQAAIDKLCKEHGIVFDDAEKK